jgi:hypothetical protein
MEAEKPRQPEYANDKDQCADERWNDEGGEAGSSVGDKSG